MRDGHVTAVQTCALPISGDVDAVSAALDPQHRSGVVAVRAHRHRAGLLRPFVTSARRTEAVEYVVVEVELEGGAVGQGSAAETVAVTGEDAESILTTLTGPLTTALTGARGSLTELSALVAGAAPAASSARRSEERRVGKECRPGRRQEHA